MEFETSKRMAQELSALGFEVTTNFGGNSVVGVYKNGEGNTLLLRTDMDALPILEKTGFIFASKVRAKDNTGIELPVMHACGHDVHMTVWVGGCQYHGKVEELLERNTYYDRPAS